MKTGQKRKPFVAPHILELWPQASAERRQYRRITSRWTPVHKLRVGMAMSALLGKGMKLEIAREHPEWPAKKVTLEVGRLNWGWEIAPPLRGPLEEEACARGESPRRRAEFLAGWRLDLADETVIRREREIANDRENPPLSWCFTAGPCG